MEEQGYIDFKNTQYSFNDEIRHELEELKLKFLEQKTVNKELLNIVKVVAEKLSELYQDVYKQEDIYIHEESK